MKEFWKNVFSENGVPSCKRVAGMFIMLCVMVIVIYWSFGGKGCSECVKDIIQTLTISAMALMGLSSVTSIFKRTPKNDDTK